MPELSREPGAHVQTMRRSGLIWKKRRCGNTAAACKVFAAEAATQIGMNAIQILGGYGYTKEYPVERYMHATPSCGWKSAPVRAKSCRLLVARHLLKQIESTPTIRG